MRRLKKRSFPLLLPRQRGCESWPLQSSLLGCSVDHIRFLWVHFQFNDLCEATSDHAIRQVLKHLPEGLHETYSRILSKISNNVSKDVIIKIFKWMACARRTLTIQELQEAIAFDSTDEKWNPEKIPDADKMVSLCLGLVVREDQRNVRFAHHTVQQFLLLDKNNGTTTSSVKEPIRDFQFTLEEAEEMAAEICAIYLCFSDFQTAVAILDVSEKRLDLTKTFQSRGPVSIAAMLGLGAPFHRLSHIFLGSRGISRMPHIDYGRYFNIKVQKLGPPVSLAKTYALLEYVMNQWHWHTRWLQPSLDSSADFRGRFWDLVRSKILSFEFRPWGQNQHFGSYGCKGCPALASNTTPPEKLPLMGLIHWAAENGHLSLLRSIPDLLLKPYLEHECYHNETFLIACRHDQAAVLKFLVEAGYDFHLERGEGLFQAACASGSVASLSFLLNKDNFRSQEFAPQFDLQTSGLDALYQAARDGQGGIAEVLLNVGVQTSVRVNDTGMTPLQIASKNGHAMIVKSLLQHGADSKIRGRDHIVMHNVSGTRIEDSWQRTALHHAATLGLKGVVETLLDHGWPIDSRDRDGRTALHHASLHGATYLVKILLDRGCPIDFEDCNNITALHAAIRKNNYDVASVLIERGAALRNSRGLWYDES